MPKQEGEVAAYCRLISLMGSGDVQDGVQSFIE